MVDLKDRKKEVVRKAVRKIASTEAGVIFFQWLKERCHFEFTTLSGNPQTYEVNTIGSIAREFERKVYLDIRQAFTEEHKFEIEVKPDKTIPVKPEGDSNVDKTQP